MNRKLPWMQFIPSNVVVNVATLGPIGFWKKAPGTWGSLAGLVFYTMVFFNADAALFFVLEAFLIYAAIQFCGEAELRMGRHDPPEVVLDEFVARPLCFIGLKGTMEQYSVWMVMILGFALFRFFDILKPLGIRKLQKLQGGLGVVIDDVAAGIATCLCLHGGFFLWERYLSQGL